MKAFQNGIKKRIFETIKLSYSTVCIDFTKGLLIKDDNKEIEKIDDDMEKEVELTNINYDEKEEKDAMTDDSEKKRKIEIITIVDTSDQSDEEERDETYYANLVGGWITLQRAIDQMVWVVPLDKNVTLLILLKFFFLLQKGNLPY